MLNSLDEEKTHFFCKKVLLYTKINLSVVLEITISKFSYSLKMMSRNTFPEPQSDSASYICVDVWLLSSSW